MDLATLKKQNIFKLLKSFLIILAFLFVILIVGVYFETRPTSAAEVLSSRIEAPAWKGVQALRCNALDCSVDFSTNSEDLPAYYKGKNISVRLDLLPETDVERKAIDFFINIGGFGDEKRSLHVSPMPWVIKVLKLDGNPWFVKVTDQIMGYPVDVAITHFEALTPMIQRASVVFNEEVAKKTGSQYHSEWEAAGRK